MSLIILTGVINPSCGQSKGSLLNWNFVLIICKSQMFTSFCFLSSPSPSPSGKPFDSRNRNLDREGRNVVSIKVVSVLSFIYSLGTNFE